MTQDMYIFWVGFVARFTKVKFSDARRDSSLSWSILPLSCETVHPEVSSIGAGGP